ncbi:hypothetical protein WR25_09536 [Diploscapter pachys]|uniref:VWFA domain-containing protein n=1 Tax=Diploscapter pachys TaxID=2018661 RepID=A0A2A2KPR0_9BILA|nr:hypothetical protein WR25_09536 [Diploscapter pachys]
MDIVFAVDLNSFTADNFGNAKSFIGDFVDSIDMAPDVSRISILFVSSDIHVPLPLGGYQEKEHLKSLLRDYSYPAISDSQTIDASNAIRQQFTTFPRTDASKLVIILTNNNDW